MPKIMTDHLDIWTTAQKQKKAVGRGRAKKDTVYGIKKLRELILELAVRGKLVPQDANDEPASILLEKIAKEKQRLIKEGKIKKQRKIKEITDDEKLFLLPNNWKWSRFTDYYDVRDGTHDSPKSQDQGYPLVTSKNLYTGTLNLTNVNYISEDDHRKIILRSKVNKGDILFAMIGSIGNPVIVNIEEEFSIKNVALFKYYSSELSVPRYLQIYLKLASVIMKKKASGGVQSFVPLGKLRAYVMAVPPLAEQHRIVAKVDELMALCDQLEQEQIDHQATHQILVETLLNSLVNAANNRQTKDKENTQYSCADYFNQLIAEHFETLFTTEKSIEQLKQTILQLAVMGKLVPQDPNDKPASALLEKIAKEKAKLLKEGKIKKQKVLPKIEEDEKPFELPDGWEWARIGMSALSTDYGLSEKTFDDPTGIPVLKMGDILNGKIILGGQKTVPNDVDKLPKLFLENGDLLYNRTNSPELVGKTGVFFGVSNTYTFASYLIRIRLETSLIVPEYLNICMNSNYFRKTQIEPHLKQQCGQANVNGTIMKNMCVPISADNEQHRIVKKVNELLTLCDSLKANLNQAQTIQTQLADTLVQQAVH